MSSMDFIASVLPQLGMHPDRRQRDWTPEWCGRPGIRIWLDPNICVVRRVRRPCRVWRLGEGERPTFHELLEALS
jgi:hypothetical protein